MQIDQRFLLIDALSLFLLDREAQNLTIKTLRTYRKRLMKFVDWCSDQGITHITDLTTVHIRAHQAHLVSSMKDISANNRASDVKTFLKFCVAEELIDKSPADRVKLPKMAERLPEVLTKKEAQQMYKACKTDRERALFLVMLDTGARCAEVSGMNIGDVNIDEGEILIREGKFRRDRMTYVSAKTRKAILKYIKGGGFQRGALWRSMNGGGRLTEDGIANIVSKIARRASVKCTPHKIRRSFVTWMLRSGVDTFTLMKLSGHKSLEAMQPYVRVADIDAERAHRRASPVSELLE